MKNHRFRRGKICFLFSLGIDKYQWIFLQFIHLEAISEFKKGTTLEKVTKRGLFSEEYFRIKKKIEFFKSLEFSPSFKGWGRREGVKGRRKTGRQEGGGRMGQAWKAGR